MVYETFPRGWKGLNGSKKELDTFIKDSIEHSDPETTTSSEIL